MPSLPLEEENGDDDADDEDDSEHGPHHPQQALFLVHDWLRIHIRRGHGIRIRAGGVHRLQGDGGFVCFHTEMRLNVDV